MQNDTRLGRVALLQRFIPHYRFPLYDKLNRHSKYAWTFYCDKHPGGDNSGLQAPDISSLEVRQVRNIQIGGPLLYQRGLNVARNEFDALMVDLGWTILSNPVHLTRARARGIATIGWSKGVSQHVDRAKPWLRRSLERWLTFRCDALVVYGQLSREYFEALGYPANRIFVAQNTVDTVAIAANLQHAKEKARQIRAHYSIPDRPVVGYLGKIASFKRVDCIVKAFEVARLQGMDAVLVMAGNGPMRDALREQIQASRFRDDIYFIDHVPPGEEVGYFQLFDLFASYSQGGLAILEAMAHGCAVLSTPERFPETEPLFQHQAGFISANFDITSFADTMMQAFIDNKNRASKASHAQKVAVTQVSQERMVEQIDQAVAVALQIAVRCKAG